MSVVGAVVLVTVLVVATAVGVVLQRRDGRVRASTPTANERLRGWEIAGVSPAADDRVLLLQLSSPICTPCARTREQLRTLAADRPGIRHVEVDIAERPEVARDLHVMRTPTTVAFERAGTELLRVGGVPRPADLVAALPLEETR